MKRIALILLSLIFVAGHAAAQQPTVRIELNKLEPIDQVCRAYLVLENETASAFESLRLDMVMFDTDGVVAKRLAVETAPLPAGKTSLKVFDIEDLGCDAIGRVLLNAVMTCTDGSGGRDDCLDLIVPASRSAVEFFK